MTEATSGADTVALDMEGLEDDFQHTVANIPSPISDDGEVALDMEGLEDNFQHSVANIPSPISDDGEEALHSFNREDLDPNFVSSIIGKSLLEPKILKASYDSKSCSIYRVPDWLRKDNGEVYDPQSISIGPFHYEKRKGTLRAMEEHKWRFLHNILSRKPEGWLEDCLATVKGLEKKARNYYSELVTLDSNSFVEMMVLDGCFIVEFFNKLRLGDNDFIVRLEWLKTALNYDFLLLENQIPFFILQHLSILIDGEHPLSAESVLNFLEGDFTTGTVRPDRRIRHLLDLLHASYYVRYPIEYTSPSQVPMIPCASKHEEKGITFRKRGGFLDIEFENGVINIPRIQIWGKTKILFLNLIALEQCSPHTLKLITTYAFFMDCLINTPKDVEILCREGIISNNLGSEELVASLFNNMTREVIIFRDFYLVDVFKKINQYSERTWPKLRASLVHDYFNNPWAIISFFAALLLLLLTMTQTLFSSFPKFAFGN